MGADDGDGFPESEIEKIAREMLPGGYWFTHGIDKNNLDWTSDEIDIGFGGWIKISLSYQCKKARKRIAENLKFEIITNSDVNPLLDILGIVKTREGDVPDAVLELTNTQKPESWQTKLPDYLANVDRIIAGFRFIAGGEDSFYARATQAIKDKREEYLKDCTWNKSGQYKLFDIVKPGTKDNPNESWILNLPFDQITKSGEGSSLSFEFLTFETPHLKLSRGVKVSFRSMASSKPLYPGETEYEVELPNLQANFEITDKGCSLPNLTHDILGAIVQDGGSPFTSNQPIIPYSEIGEFCEKVELNYLRLKQSLPELFAE